MSMISTRASRALALPFVFLALALHVAVAFWIAPVARLDTILLVWFAGMLVPFAGYLLIITLLRRAFERPATFRVDADRHRFSVAVVPVGAGCKAILQAWIVGGVGEIVTTQVGLEGRVKVTEDLIQLALAIVVPATFLGIVVACLLLSRSCLTLDQEGISRSGGSSLRIRWKELAAVGPPSAVGRRPARIRLYRKPRDGYDQALVENLRVRLRSALASSEAAQVGA